MSIEILGGVPNKNKYQKWASGTLTVNSNAVRTITGLLFNPKKVIVFAIAGDSTTDANDFMIISDTSEIKLGPNLKSQIEGSKTSATALQIYSDQTSNKVLIGGFQFFAQGLNFSQYKWVALGW